MRQVYLFCLAIGLVLSGACVRSDTVTIKEHKVIEVPDGSNSKSLKLGRIVTKLPRGHLIGTMSAGLACMPYSNLYWKSGKMESKDEEFYSIFEEELRRNNYNIVGDSSDLFKESHAASEFIVSGLITNIKMDVCVKIANVGVSRTTISIEWQVYSNMQKRVVLKTTSDGEGEINFSKGNHMESLYLAFSSATQGLLSKKEFNDLVTGAAAESNAGVEQAVINQLAPGSPFGVVPGAQKQPLSLDEVKKRVVVVDLGQDGHGSGVLVGDEGYILTNAHVVGGLERVAVQFENGTRVEGKVLASVKGQDVGLVKVDNPPVKGLSVRTERLATGTDVYAVGAPKQRGLHGTVTKGIVSGYRANPDGSQWLQSDTTINSGNSGGPLVDAQGRVVGLSTWKMVGENVQGLNFFAPIAEVLKAANLAVQ